jgi:hypothetical protein
VRQQAASVAERAAEISMPSSIDARSCSDDTLTSNVICSSFPRPRVALCFAGSARTFEQPAVYRSIKTNLIDAFAGTPTTFAVLKLEDSRLNTITALDQIQLQNEVVNTSEARVRIALSHLGVRQQQRLVTSKVLPGTRSQSCGRPVFARTPGTNRNNYDSAMTQLNNRQACHRLIEAEERRPQGLTQSARPPTLHSPRLTQRTQPSTAFLSLSPH